MAKKKPQKVHSDIMYVCSPPQNACGGCFACSWSGRKPTGYYAGAKYGCLSLMGLMMIAPTALGLTRFRRWRDAAPRY